jgi:cytochrome c oxidase cbb3-type subunit 4
MDKYTLLRDFADSWGMLAMMAVFLLVLVVAFRRGSGGVHSDAANIPLRGGDNLDEDIKHVSPDITQPKKEART